MSSPYGDSRTEEIELVSAFQFAIITDSFWSWEPRQPGRSVGNVGIFYSLSDQLYIHFSDIVKSILCLYNSSLCAGWPALSG